MTQENTGCELCEDNKGPFYVHAKCHLTAPLKACIEGGWVILKCYIPECDREVWRFKVVSTEGLETR